MKYYSCYGVVKFHTFNNIPLKKSACTFRRDFKIFQTAAKTAAAARSKVVRAVSARLRGRGVRAVQT